MKSCRLLLLFAVCSVPAFGQSGEIATLRNVKSAGALKARQAAKKLANGETATLLKILEGFSGTDPIAANWLRSAFETSLSTRLAGDRPFPIDAFSEFVRDTRQDGRARRLAYDWMVRHDSSVAEKLIPGMLLDSVPEFRRDAVARLITEAGEQLEDGRKDDAAGTLRTALRGVIHRDQMKQITKPLRELGHKVNVQRHFGFLPNWSLIGPFDNKGGSGFAAQYSPEKTVDLKGELKGQLGPVRWQQHSTDDDYGSMNIAKAMSNFKGSCVYATTTFTADEARTVDFRIATPNAWKLWVNGQFVFGHNEYHRAPAELPMDQYRVTVKLKKGQNRILMKVCQNEQDQDWAQRYEFQLRVCDATGSAVRSVTDRKSARLER